MSDKHASQKCIIDKGNVNDAMFKKCFQNTTFTFDDMCFECFNKYISDNMDKIIHEATVNGNIYSMISLGFYHYNRRSDEAKQYYMMAVQKNCASAMHLLGLYFQHSEHNYEEMKKYYEMAVENGENNAMVSLGNYYRGQEKNFELMEKYYVMALEKGNKFGLIYLVGKSKPVGYSKTIDDIYQSIKNRKFFRNECEKMNVDVTSLGQYDIIEPLEFGENQIFMESLSV